MIKVGLIGYGMAGRVFHAPVIAAVPGLQLTKVVERRGETARERYPWIEIVKDAAAVCEDGEIDLMVIATPTASHFELAEQALLAGKHVVVDKPFTVSSGQARRQFGPSPAIDRSRPNAKPAPQRFSKPAVGRRFSDGRSNSAPGCVGATGGV